MTRSTQLVSGQSATLPPGYLSARLTGSTRGVQLRLLDASGSEASESRETDSEVVVRPRSGRFQLLAVPLGAAVFGDGSRVGAEVKIVAGAGDSSPQVLISDVDSGALKQQVIASLDFVEGRGWTVVGGSHDPFSMLMETSRQTPEPILDDTRLPWLSEGRYFLRRSLNGEVPPRSSDRRWALILDNSASMQTVLDAEGAALFLERVSGILAEWSGRLAEITGLSGGLAPEWHDVGREDPRALLLAASDDRGAASWCLLEPAVRHAMAQGARTIVVVTDGPPADLELIMPLISTAPGVGLMVVLAQSGGGDGTAEEDGRTLAVGALGSVGGRDVRGGVIDLSSNADDQQWVDLAGLLAGAI